MATPVGVPKGGDTSPRPTDDPQDIQIENNSPRPTDDPQDTKPVKNIEIDSKDASNETTIEQIMDNKQDTSPPIQQSQPQQQQTPPNIPKQPSLLTQEVQESIIIEDEKKEVSIIQQPVIKPMGSVTDFVSGLTPFISALEDFDGTASPKAGDDNKSDVNRTGGDNDNNQDKNNKNKILDSTKIEERVMRPIRELIYKSFHEPSEGEEGIEYVISQLQNLKRLSEGCSTDLVVRSIGHFLSLSLPPSWIDSMCRWMLDRMQLILLKFFTFKHYCSCYFNTDINSSRIFVLQCALHRRFPLLISEGCASLSRSPVFYGTKQCSLFNDNNYIRCSWQLLQTGASFKIIPLHRSTHHHHSSSSKRKSKHHKKDNNKKSTKSGDKNNNNNNNNDDILGQLNEENIITPLTMDLRTLEQEIERDQSKGRLPCVVIASPTDNLQKIRSICDRHGLWLHIEGGSSSLLLAAATTLPKTTRIMMQCADSISCQPFEWFTTNSNNPSNNSNNIQRPKAYHSNKPKITTRPKTKNVHVSITSNTKKNYFGDDIPGCTSTLTFIKEDLRDTPPPSIQYSDSDFVMMFPLWHLLVTRSIKGIKNRVDHSLNLCKYLNQQLLQHKNIFTTSLLSSSLPQIVIFQITPNINVIDLSLFKLDINTFHELLINRCNQEINNLHIEWKLYDDDDDIDSLNNINIIDNDDGNDGYNRFHYYGSDDDGQQQQQQQQTSTNTNNNNDSINITPYFRFEPLSYSQPELIRNEYISGFIEKIVVEINILRKCLELRRSFQEYIDNDNDLEFVDSMTVQTIMIGLGAFRFVPSFFKNNIESESVHILNKCLCDELNLINNATITQMYKLSIDINGIVCIVINPTNMVFEQNCCLTIYKQIQQCHQKMKYPQEVMDVMAQAIKTGINTAKKVVEDQANADYTVDSIVRKVPIFGSVYGWLLPDDTNNSINDISDIAGNTGIGFQIGVGMTKPQIQRQPQTPTPDVVDNDNNDNDNNNNNNNPDLNDDNNDNAVDNNQDNQ